LPPAGAEGLIVQLSQSRCVGFQRCLLLLQDFGRSAHCPRDGVVLGDELVLPLRQAAGRISRRTCQPVKHYPGVAVQHVRLLGNRPDLLHLTGHVAVHCARQRERVGDRLPCRRDFLLQLEQLPGIARQLLGQGAAVGAKNRLLGMRRFGRQ